MLAGDAKRSPDPELPLERSAAMHHIAINGAGLRRTVRKAAGAALL